MPQAHLCPRQDGESASGAGQQRWQSTRLVLCRLREDHPLRVRLRAQERPQARDVRRQGQHHEAHGRPLLQGKGGRERRRQAARPPHARPCLPAPPPAFPQIFEEIGKREYPDIARDRIIVDIGAAMLADQPERFDVMVTLNLYGDSALRGAGG